MRHAILALAALLCACATSDVPRPAPPGKAAPPDKPSAPPPANVEGPVAGLTLERALALADGAHPRMAEALARLEAAREREAAAGRADPLTGIARVESLAPGGGGLSEADVLLGVSKTLPTGDRLRAERDLATAQTSFADKEVLRQRAELHARVRAAFAAALHLSHEAAVRRALARLDADAVALARSRVDAGDALPEDVVRAEIEGNRARVEGDRTEAELRAALEGLAGEIGPGVLRITSVAGDLPAPGPAASLDELPAIQAAVAEVAAFEAQAALEEARRHPDIDVEVLYRYIGADDEHGIDLGVTIPFVDRERAAANVRASLADVRAARARADSARNDAARGLREAWTAHRLADATASALRNDVLRRADDLLRQLERRHELGDLAFVEVLRARRDRNEVELLAVAADREVLAARARLASFGR